MEPLFLVYMETQNSKGFAFITYSKREEAKRAIEKLNQKKWADIDVDDDESINDNEIKKKWEDIDADDDLEANKKLSYFTNYENGIKVVTKYSENLKKQTVKVTKKIQEVVIKKKLNKEINNRLNLKNFNIDIVRNKLKTRNKKK
ncbi:hypothetical protein PFFCH_03564 [Plasmodium falciparum FCH/4]|uniref:RRM domain-containing protein n=1 Tax=Plasmodium falciparum FCH/4 TaxID=1036724 RepID=A0A024VM87_PLAFA|nr:hypothetical protein PFFCH_03564 [Plasmodium falciparum FCH/4]